MKINIREIGALFVLVGMLLSTGCVSEQLEPEDNPRLGVVQSNDGMVAFALESKVGYKYSIMYMDPNGRSWKPIKGCESIIGTGRTIEIKKRFNSRGPLPSFTVNYSKL